MHSPGDVFQASPCGTTSPAPLTLTWASVFTGRRRINRSVFPQKPQGRISTVNPSRSSSGSSTFIQVLTLRPRPPPRYRPPSMATTAESLRADATEKEAQAAELLDQVRVLRRDAEILRDAAERLDGSRKKESTSFVHTGTMDETMQASKDEIAPRRGAKIQNTKLPMARASANSGLSIFAIALKLKVPYSTVKSWGVKSLPPDNHRATLAGKPYLVPETAWKL